MQTFRRLNDPERYYGLSWRGWLGVGAGGGLLYLAIRVSPVGVKPTISLTVIGLAIAGAGLYALSGQALGPGRHAMALIRHRCAAKQLTAPGSPDRQGLVLASAAPQATAPVNELDPELEQAFQ